jgi:hypothetical protein
MAMTCKQSAIAGAREPVADHLAGRHLDGDGAGVAGDGGCGVESGDGSDSAEDLAGGQCSATVQFDQGCPGRGDSGLDIGGGLGDAAIQLPHLAD